MPKDPSREPETQQRKGIRGIFKGLFSSDAPVEEPATQPAPASSPSYGGGAKVSGARVPSRDKMTGASLAAGAEKNQETQEKEPQITPQEDPANLVLVRGNKMYELACRAEHKSVPDGADLKYNIMKFFSSTAVPTAEQRAWLKEVEKDLRTLPQYAFAAHNNKAAPGDETEGEALQAVDGCCFIRISKDAMEVWGFSLPPFLGGEGLTPEKIYTQLAATGIDTGVDSQAIDRLCASRLPRVETIARGVAPVHGEDGDIVDHFARGLKIVLTVQDDNTIDFRDLGWLQTCSQDDIICEVIPPTPGVDGIDVRGQAVPARDGRPKAAPMGPGTCMSPDGLQLLAQIDGVISFVNDAFHVDPLLIVPGDVDTAVGNLDVIGNLLIYGDVREGFSVKATGDIAIQGMVEAATIQCEGSVLVGQGVNGNNTGLMQVDGDVICKFIENTTVHAKGSVISDTIINSVIVSNKSVQALSGKGVIIGGSITASEFIEAIHIGNESNRLIEIILGNTSEYWREKAELDYRLQHLEMELQHKEKNLEYLISLENPGTEETAILEELQRVLPIQRSQHTNVKRRLTILAGKATDVTGCYLKAKVIHPPLELTIGEIAAELRQPIHHSRVFRQEDAIQVEELPAEEFMVTAKSN